MSFEHDAITGRFVCPRCSGEFLPTRRAALRDWDGLAGVVDEYAHVCRGEAYVTHPAVISPFPDRFEGLLRRMLEVFPPIEEAA